jgi:hypothetical protein
MKFKWTSPSLLIIKQFYKEEVLWCLAGALPVSFRNWCLVLVVVVVKPDALV